MTSSWSLILELTHRSVCSEILQKKHKYVNERHSAHIALCDMYESQNKQQLCLIQY